MGSSAKGRKRGKEAARSGKTQLGSYWKWPGYWNQEYISSFEIPMPYSTCIIMHVFVLIWQLDLYSIRLKGVPVHAPYIEPQPHPFFFCSSIASTQHIQTYSSKPHPSFLARKSTFFVAARQAASITERRKTGKQTIKKRLHYTVQ